MTDKVMALWQEISWHLDEIEKRFRDPVKMTVVVRNLASPDRDVVMGNDEPEEAIKAIRRLADSSSIKIPADFPSPPLSAEER